MAFSKRNLYLQEEQFISLYTHALGYPARVRIIRKLKEKGPLCVKDIAEGHPISKESLSDHLKILREAQLLSCFERFPFTFYEVNEENLALAYKMIDGFFKSMEGD